MCGIPGNVGNLKVVMLLILLMLFHDINFRCDMYNDANDQCILSILY